MTLKLYFCLVALFSCYAQAADILILTPMASYSHVIPFLPVYKELSRRGHNVTMVTTVPKNLLPKEANIIPIDWSISDLNVEISKTAGVGNLHDLCKGFLFGIVGLTPFCTVLSPLIMNKVKTYLPPQGTKYDLVIVEAFFCMEPLLVASHIYNAPIIATMPLPSFPAVTYALGNPMATYSVPNLRLPYTNQMNFFQRTWNVITSCLDVVVHRNIYLPRMDRIMREILGFKDAPYVGDLFQNVSLVLSATHFTMYPRPISKNIVEFGGWPSTSVEPLPEDVDRFVNEAEHGIIYFSWGSHFKAKHADSMIANMMVAFGKIKQRVLFKWYKTTIPNIPDNVFVKEWFPQTSILAHNKTVLFISHCGQNSMYETTYFGVPVIGTPVFGDQFQNAKMLESKGMAVTVYTEDVDRSSRPLEEAIHEIISKPSYKENAMKRMSMLRDRPTPPLDEAVYWIEYVMKYGGTHLQPSSRDMSWYSVTLLDVWTFIITITAIIIYIIYKSILMCISVYRGCSNYTKNQDLNEKKNL